MGHVLGLGQQFPQVGCQIVSFYFFQLVDHITPFHVYSHFTRKHKNFAPLISDAHAML